MTSANTEEMGKLRIISLGGVDEIGKNMTVFEYGDDIIIVDCGSARAFSGEIVDMSKLI